MRPFSMLVLVVGVLLCAPAASVQAVPINYSVGFESAEGFPFDASIPELPGDLSGWIRFDEVPAEGPLPTIKIGNINNGGTQGLTFQTLGSSGTSDFSSAVSPVAGLPGALDVVANGTPLIRIKWDMRIDDQEELANNSLNWGLDVFGATPETLDPPPLLVNVSRIVDGVGPLVLGTDPNEEFGAVLVEDGPASGAWATYQIDLDYTNYTYQFSLNGVAMGGAHPFFAIDNGLDVGLTVSLRGIDAGHFDNFSVMSVPEPSGFALALVASLLLKRRLHASSN